MTTEEKLKIIKSECNTHFVDIDEWDEKYIYLNLKNNTGKNSQILHDIYLIMLEIEKFFPRTVLENLYLIKYYE